MRGTARHHEKTPPPHVCEREGAPTVCTCKKRQSVEKEKERKEGDGSQSEGMSQSEARGKARPQSNLGKSACPKAQCEREGVASCRRRGVMGKRGSTTWKVSTVFGASQSQPWEHPQKAPHHLLMTAWTRSDHVCHFCDSSPPQQQHVGFLFFFLLPFPLTIPLSFSQVHRDPLSVANMRGSPFSRIRTHGALATRFVFFLFFLFSFSPLTAPFFS